MRYITIPRDVTIESMLSRNGEPAVCSFRSFLLEWVLPDPRWRSDESWVMTHIRVFEKIRHTLASGDVLELTDEEHEKLSAVCRLPANPYPPPVVNYLMYHISAVVSAACSKPKGDSNAPA